MIRKSGPTQTDVHVNAPLTNISVAFMQSEEGFVARKVFPTVPVAKQSDRYYVYNRGDFNRDEMQKRADSTESAGGGYRVDNTPSYFCDVWAFHKDVGEQVRANSDTPLQPDRDATEYVTRKGLIKQEIVFAAQYLTAGVWASDQTGVSAGPAANQFLQWNDDASTPIEQIRAEMTLQQLRSTFRPNVMLLGQQVLDALVDHPDIVDRVKYGTQSQVSIVDVAELKALWKIQRVLVMSGIHNASQEGIAEANAFISGKVAWLGYAAPNPGLLTPSAGYDFRWTGLLGSVGGQGARISKFPMRQLGVGTERIEIELAFDLKVIATEMGTLFVSAVA